MPAEEWDQVSKICKQKLTLAQEKAMVQNKPSVHGDCRLNNVVVKRISGGFDVQFVDFAWSGLANQHRSGTFRAHSLERSSHKPSCYWIQTHHVTRGQISEQAIRVSVGRSSSKEA